MFRIIDHRYWYFAFSAIVLTLGVVAIGVFGLRLSIDYVGGTIYDIAFEEPIEGGVDRIREVYTDVGLEGAQPVRAEHEAGDRYIVRSASVTPEEKETLANRLREEIGPFEELRLEVVGPSVGQQVTRDATIAVAVASLAILLYLTVMFRSVPHPMRYGVAAILALLHDTGVVLAAAAVMGAWRGWEIDALFLTAVLTIIGFSVHDSIVVFDRIRENSGRMRGRAYESIVNHSVIQTLDRSINTQITALFTLVAIFLFSQGQIEQFLFWLIVGMVSGTYSSIFVAAPLLVVWQNREWRGWFGRRGEAASAA